MKDILKKAVDTWGEDAQIMAAIQEMAELIKELTDIRRNRTDENKLASEIADVQIMLEQLKYIFSKKYENFEKIIEEEKNKKIIKIINKLNCKIH
ncbi:hypothetical protein EOM09_05430 [bacterium]|nr:hypothetical protein [bacterium]